MLQGAIGRSSRVSFGFGITRARSTPITRPKPWHSVQAPRGELKEKRGGVGARAVKAQTGQIRLRE